MESGGAFCWVLLWAALLTAAPVECTEYSDRTVYQCTVTAKQEPVKNSKFTDVWIDEMGIVEFATTLKWEEVKGLSSGFSDSTCHSVGKVKDVLPPTPPVTAQAVDNKWFHSFHPLNEIEEFFRRLEKLHPNVLKVEKSIGKSFKGRDIFAVHISNFVKSVSAPKKPKIYIQCLIHAREWISGSVCQAIAYHLVTVAALPLNQQSGVEKRQVEQYLQKFMFVIVPVVNPDGYLMSWEGGKNRLWRKNVNPTNGKKKGYYGVDLCRNFPYHWDNTKTIYSGKKGDDKERIRKTLDLYEGSYRGPAAKSESETRTIIDYIKHLAPVYGAIDYHSFGQFVLHPYMWSTIRSPPNAKRLITVANKVAEAMKESNNNPYTVADAKGFYIAGGTFGDWAYSEGVAATNFDGTSKKNYRIISLSIELFPPLKYIFPSGKGIKDEFTLGFRPPKEKIIPTCYEAIAGLMAFAEELMEPMEYP